MRRHLVSAPPRYANRHPAGTLPDITPDPCQGPVQPWFGSVVGMNTKGPPPGPRRPPAPVGCWADRRQNRDLHAQGALTAKGAYGRLGGAAAAQGGHICPPRSEHSLD
jgi:hypothetical protein